MQTSPPEDVLSRRIAASQPVWESYQEDIKGQIGAGPVAEWEGVVEAANVSTPEATVRIRIAGPWATRKVAVPVLLRDPVSGVHASHSASCEAGIATYRFKLPPSPTPPPWIELKFPHGERRLVLSPEGIWTRPG